MQRLVALILFILISPLLFLLFLLVKLTSRGPFVFKQKRIGKDFKIFTIYKIRTMAEDAENCKDELLHLNEVDGPVFKIRDDPRFTPIGKLLSRTGLDEILQLINVIRGEMFFVGPRPLPINEANRIPKIFKERFSVKPGITSLWVIRGAHDLSFKEWMLSDIEYLKKRSIFLDLTIFLITIFSIIKWNSQKIFLLFFPLIILFYAFYPDTVWWTQILVFFSILLFLNINVRKRPPLLFWCLAFFLFISTFYSINKLNSVPAFFSYLVIFFLTATFIEERKKDLLNGFVLGTIYIGTLSTIYTLTKIVIGELPPALISVDTFNNLIIPRFSHAMYGVFLIATIPYVLERINKEKRQYHWNLVFLLFMVFTVITFSKASIFFGFLEVLTFEVIVILRHKKNITLKQISVFLVTIVIFSFFLLIYLPKNNWLKTKIIKPSLPTRLEYWRQAWKVLQNSSFFRLSIGYGPESFFELSNKYQSQPGNWVASVHNFPLQLLVETGLLTTLFFFFYLISTLIKNFKKYTLSEKLTIFFLFFYSFGSSADLNAFPILLLFFILLRKDSQKTVNVKTGYAFPYLIAITLLFFYWARYVYVYSYYKIMHRPSFDILRIFPFETDFWLTLIENKDKDMDKLTNVYSQLKKYSQINVEGNRSLINKSYNNQAYCFVVSTSQDFLRNAPFDVGIQNIFTESLGLCRKINTADLITYFQEIKSSFYTEGARLYQMRHFLDFVARYSLENGYFDESIFWFDRTWQADLWDPYSLENIDIIKRLEKIDKIVAAGYLEKYLLAKEKTNYRHFYHIALETAKEWLTLAGWWDDLKEMDKAKSAYKASIESYKYDGKVYFEYAKFLGKHKMKDDIAATYLLCNKNFNNAPWCRDLANYSE